MNSRLELPAEHGRRHKRSLTSGSNFSLGSGAGERVSRSGSRSPEMAMSVNMNMNTGLKRSSSGVSGGTGVSAFSVSSGSSRGSGLC